MFYYGIILLSLLLLSSASIGSDSGLATNMWQAIIWTNSDPIQWRIYAALGGGGELTKIKMRYYQHS